MAKTLAEIVGWQIYERRLARNWSQTELARVLEVTDKQVSRWEGGKQAPPLATLERIAAALGVRITDLLDGR